MVHTSGHRLGRRGRRLPAARALGPHPRAAHLVGHPVLGALLAVGIAVLRREIAREFPDAGDDGTGPPPAPATVTQPA